MGLFSLLIGKTFIVQAEDAIVRRWMWAPAKLPGIPGSLASCTTRPSLAKLPRITESFADAWRCAR